MPINLILSLVFGAGQIVAGVLVTRNMLAGGSWRRPRALLLIAVSCWFIASGVCELFVSGMETAQSVGGTPSPATLALWRGCADEALLGVSVALVVLFAGACVLLRTRGGAAQR